MIQVTIIVERAVHQESYAFVRSVMGFSKVLDPMLPQDVIQTCTYVLNSRTLKQQILFRARLAYHNKHGFAEPTPIFKGYTKYFHLIKLTLIFLSTETTAQLGGFQ